MSRVLEATVDQEAQNEINHEMGGFFDDKVLQIDVGGADHRSRRREKDDAHPEKHRQPVLNFGGGHV